MTTLDSVMAELRARGKPSAVKTYRRHGVRGETSGVSYADLGLLVRRIGVNHELAVGLWNSELHDARTLATMVASPTRMTEADLDAWLADIENYGLDAALAELAARHAQAEAIAQRWTAVADQWPSAAGWNIFAILAKQGALPEREAATCLQRIAVEIGTAANWTRYSMNNALISIGGRMPALRDAAIATAQSIGPVQVDHGPTWCVTPDALAHIARVAARPPPRRRSTAWAR
jgi:3-methyladenine DNA glycosylase AlkD